MTKLISWFEIPALDLARARAFYDQIFGVSLQEWATGQVRMAVFPYDRDHATGGCVQSGPGYTPSRDGAVLYLNAGDSIDAVLDRVPAAGGEVALPKTVLPEGMGVYAHIFDTEGNRVGLHAMK